MSTQIYHVSRERGPMPCHAKPNNCPIGGQHYSNIEDAKEAYIRDLERNYPSHVTIKTRKEIENSLSYKFHHVVVDSSAKNSKNYVKTIKNLNRARKATMFIVGMTVFEVAVTSRVTDSLIKGKQLFGRRKLNAKKLLMTKHWAPKMFH